MIGRTLGHYEITALIGRGGMGEVYRARDTRLERDVALKVLPADVAADPARLERFEREAKTVAGINHHHIVTLYSVEEADGVRFLTMELVEGETLDAIIRSDGLALSQVFDIGIAVADALAAAHDRGIVHRDLKPANVMIARDGRIKVLDFGLAKLTQAALSDTHVTMTSPLTMEGALMGTVPYMSPEQLRGQHVDHRSDIFALGILLYEMTAGRRPFLGDTNSDVTSAILRDVPPPLDEVRPNLPRRLARIAARCLEKDPRGRYQSAAEVRNELRAVRREIDSGVSVIGSGETRMLTARMPGRKTWLIPAVAAAIVIAALAFALVRGDHGKQASGPKATAVTNSLAVLPFVNMSPEKEQEYFSDGLTEELLNALSKIPDLKVAGRTSSFSFKGKNQDLREVGKELGVAHILEGSVRKSGNTVRITAQLVKAEDGFHLWSQTYDRTLDDIFVVQADIARSVAEELKVTLLRQPSKEPAAQAYDLVLQARYAIASATKESIRNARTLLEEAIKISPDYAPAWAEMGLVHRREAERANTIAEKQEASRLCREALTRALQLDPNLAVARSRMVGVYVDEWKFEDAAREVKLALAAGPKNPIVIGNSALMYQRLGHYDEAIRLNEQVIALDPLNIIAYQNLSGANMLAGRLDEAGRILDRMLAARPDFDGGILNMAILSVMRGRQQEARAAFDKWIAIAGNGDYETALSDALVESAGGKSAPATAMEKFEKDFGEGDPLTCAEIRAVRGDHDGAFAELDRAFSAHDPAMAILLGEPLLLPLHSDPRWNVLLKKIGLPMQDA